MDRRFKLFFSLMVLLNVIIGGLAVVRLFSWKILSNVDKFFFVFASILFVFSMCMAYLFSKLDDVPKKKVDPELKELRKEMNKVPDVPIVKPVDTSILRNPEPRPVSPVARALTEDVSMYTQNRNIIKPPQPEEDKDEYSGVF